MPKKSLTYRLVATILIADALAFGASDLQIKDFNGMSNFSRTLTFNKFNPALGSLNSIQITLNTQVNGGHIIIDNDSNSEGALGTFEFGANISLYSGDVLLLDGGSPVPGRAQAYNLLPINLSTNIDDGDNDYSPLPPDGTEFDGGTISDAKSGYIGNASKESFQGTNTYNITASASLQTNYTGTTGQIEYFVTQPLTVSSSVTVIYEYTPVPEPATIALLAIGSLLALKRKKQINKRREI